MGLLMSKLCGMKSKPRLSGGEKIDREKERGRECGGVAGTSVRRVPLLASITFLLISLSRLVSLIIAGHDPSCTGSENVLGTAKIHLKFIIYFWGFLGKSAQSPRLTPWMRLRPYVSFVNLQFSVNSLKVSNICLKVVIFD